MGIFDALSGAAGMAIPGANLLAMIPKALELVQSLIGKKDFESADQLMNFLNGALDGSDPSKAQDGTAEPQAFSEKTVQYTFEYKFEVSMDGKPKADLVSHDKLPYVDGSPAQDQMLTQKMGELMEGSPANKSRALQQGSNEWMTVAHALQQNPNLHYDADSQQFFAKTSDGGRMNVASLKDVQGVIEQNGGYSRSNPATSPAVNEFLNKKMGETQSADTTNDAQIVEYLQNRKAALEEKLQQIEEARRLSQPELSMTNTISVSA